MYSINFSSFSDQDGITMVSFSNKKTREIVTATPSDPDMLPLFCQIVTGKHTAMLKDNGVISLQFPMNCISSSSKSEDGLEESETIRPAPGCELLFQSSFKVSGTWDGKQIRQINFDCKVTTTPYTDDFSRYIYPDDITGSQR